MLRKEMWESEAAREPQLRATYRSPRATCEQRGYCGPFANQSYYNSLEMWAGFGDCVECGCTVPVPPGERNFQSARSWARTRPMLPPLPDD